MSANFRIGAMMRRQREDELRERKQTAEAEAKITVSEGWFSNVTGTDDAVRFGPTRGNMVGKNNLIFDQNGIFLRINTVIVVERDDARTVQFNAAGLIDSAIRYKFKNKIQADRFMGLASDVGIIIKEK